jgi:hypothetical protein
MVRKLFVLVCIFLGVVGQVRANEIRINDIVEYPLISPMETKRDARVKLEIECKKEDPRCMPFLRGLRLDIKIDNFANELSSRGLRLTADINSRYYMNVHFTEYSCGQVGESRRFVSPVMGIFYFSRAKKSLAYMRATIEIFNSEDHLLFMKEYMAHTQIEEDRRVSLLFPIDRSEKRNIRKCDIWNKLINEIAEDVKGFLS